MPREEQFEVVISDYTASAEEWRRAHGVPDDELPTLNSDQKRTARLFGLTEEAYARSVLAGNYGQERMKRRAEDLGQRLNAIAQGILAGSRVDSVIADMFRGIWLVGLRTERGGTTIEVPRDLADDVLDSGQEREKLESLVRSRLLPFSSVQR